MIAFTTHELRVTYAIRHARLGSELTVEDISALLWAKQKELVLANAKLRRGKPMVLAQRAMAAPPGMQHATLNGAGLSDWAYNRMLRSLAEKARREAPTYAAARKEHMSAD